MKGAVMHRHIGLRRKRRAGITTVEYAVILFLMGITALFGIPELSATTSKSAIRTGDALEKIATTEPGPDK